MAFVLFFLILGVASSALCIEVTDDIIERLARLEATEGEYKQEIAALKSKITAMEETFLQEINEMREKCGESDNVIESDQHLGSKPLEQRRSFKEVRGAVETEVAFYATHSKHDILHMGEYQIIVFDQVVTNIGNAYNVHYGAFTAPVDGTYIFHVTLLGFLSDTVNHHYHAYIDVDGVAYSMFWIAQDDQSSHMFVKELKAGNNVSVKNVVLNAAIVGQHFSSFSGFLLYQHSNAPAIVGR